MHSVIVNLPAQCAPRRHVFTAPPSPGLAYLKPDGIADFLASLAEQHEKTVRLFHAQPSNKTLRPQ